MSNVVYSPVQGLCTYFFIHGDSTEGELFYNLAIKIMGVPL